MSKKPARFVKFPDSGQLKSSELWLAELLAFVYGLRFEGEAEVRVFPSEVGQFRLANLVLQRDSGLPLQASSPNGMRRTRRT